MEYEKFIQPKEIVLGENKFAISKIPALMAQSIYPSIAKLVSDNGLLGLTMISVDTMRSLMAFVAVKNGEHWFTLGNDELLNNTFKDDFGDLQKLSIEVIKYTYDFFVSGNLLDALAQTAETDSVS